METNVIIALVAIVIILIVLYMKFYVLNTDSKKPVQGRAGGIGTAWTAGTGDSISAGTPRPGIWTVYGSDNCGWTLKQLAVFDTKEIPYNYINCDTNKLACKGMTAFPTLVDPNGVKTVGFNGLA